MDMRDEGQDEAADAASVEAVQIEAFRRDVKSGLANRQKSVPSRWLYDERGSELFEEITRQPEYYLTRTETTILDDNSQAIADFCGDDAVILEYGAGAGVKTEILLRALTPPATYVPIDISGPFVNHSAARIDRRFPKIDVFALVADFTADLDLSRIEAVEGPRCAFFPGSTLGNLTGEEARTLLNRMRETVGPGGKAILGIDLKKDVGTLLAAYDDAAGVTAAFELNLLTRINRELDGDFDIDGFAYEARWNAQESAIEMMLVSRTAQHVTIDRRDLRVCKGRGDPHRKLAQIRPRGAAQAVCRVRLDGRHGLVRSRGHVRGRCPHTRIGIRWISAVHHGRRAEKGQDEAGILRHDRSSGHRELRWPCAVGLIFVVAQTPGSAGSNSAPDLPSVAGRRNTTFASRTRR